MNHLFIGLGGTGGRIIQSLCKLYDQQFNDSDPRKIGIDYLWVDSDPNSFKLNLPDWQQHGRSLCLMPENQLFITHPDLKSVISNLQDYPQIKSWLGNADTLIDLIDDVKNHNSTDIVNSDLTTDKSGKSGTDLSLQQRRIGRLLLALNIDNFNDKVNGLVRSLQLQTGKDDITFHVMCGLAGGTGSGTLIDVMMQLRKAFAFSPNKSANHRIIAYTYLPDTQAPANWDIGRYHANAYAALLELNAVSAGIWQPIDIVTGSQPTYDLDCIFNGCYVFTDKNSKGYRIGIDKNLTEVVADFIYQKVVVIRQLGWDSLTKAENCENGDATPELQCGEPSRSLRFMNFGVSRIEFSRERYYESLSYEYQLQALLQLLYNNLQKHHGFIGLKRLFNPTSYLQDIDAYQSWMLTDEHLLLEHPIITSNHTKKWNTHQLTWLALSNHYLNLTNNHQTSKALIEIHRLLTHSFNEQYRDGLGVKAYFDAAENDIDTYATTIKSSIQHDIMTQWSNGERSLSECLEIVTTLIHQLEAKRSVIEDNIEAKGLLARRYMEAYQTLNDEWSSMGMLSRVTHQDNDYVTRAGGYLREHYYALTCTHAYEFKHKLLSSLIEQLTAVHRDIKKIYNMLTHLVEQSKQAIAARVVSDNSSSYYVDTLEDPALLKSLRKKLVLNEHIQQQQTTIIREHIFALLGSTPTFENFVAKNEDITRQILQTSFDNVKNAHNTHIHEPQERIFDICITDKLYSRYGNDQAQIDNKARNLIKETGYFTKFTKLQMDREFDERIANHKDNRALNCTSILMPMPDAHQAFTKVLQRSFLDNYEGDDLNFIKVDDNSHAISALSMTNLTPLRFIDLVASLKKHYDGYIKQGVANGDKQARLNLHIQDDGATLPSLFVIDINQVETALKPLILVALSCGTLIEKVNPNNGNTYISLATTTGVATTRHENDSTTLSIPAIWGSDLIDVANKITDKQLLSLKQSIDNHVMPRLPYQNGDLSKIKSRLQLILKTLSKQLDNSHDNQAAIEMREWTDATLQALEFLTKERAL